ncbi:MAG TPA: hypothetical protein VG326_11455 [Tepidisphaeraceae bacterium]|jgi:hypothetical protein|nr:hypothetical protein [Tepidisphaeraceae bacterium]
MLKTVEATLDARGRVKLKADVSLRGPTRVLVTFLDDPFTVGGEWEPAILAEDAFKPGWVGPEADEAWKHLSELADLDEVVK